MSISEVPPGLKNVYGDPVVAGNRTLIPAAQVRYAFAAGRGILAARPCGALEISPEGTRYIAFQDRRRMGAALALGFVLGAAVVGLTATRRIEIVKRVDSR
jgi:hypothetical protein